MKSYVVMDLEFMILDTMDYVRPSADYKKYEKLADLKQACATIEKFENQYYQVGKLSRDGKAQGTTNQLTEYDLEQYDKLIDNLSYHEDEESVSNRREDDIVAPSAGSSKPNMQNGQAEERKDEQAHPESADGHKDQDVGAKHTYNDDVKISKKDVEVMKKQMKEQQVLI